MVTGRDRGPDVEPGRGDAVTAADFAALAARRDAIIAADVANLGDILGHVHAPRRCYRCAARVFRYATTTDGARQYCPACVRAMGGRS